MITDKAVRAFKDVFHGERPMSYDEIIRTGLAAALQVHSSAEAVRNKSNEWLVKWYGSEPMKGASIWSATKHGLHGDMIFHIGSDEKHLKLAQIIADAHNTAIRSLSAAEPAQVAQLPQDVINLVIAAREAFDAGTFTGDEEFNLDNALEPFAERVPYANEPDHIAPCPCCQEPDCDFDCDGAYDRKHKPITGAGQ